jgi:hypothetical protein
LLATVAREIVRELDPSVEGTGPHGLTVRDAPHVLRHDRVHRIPRQRIVTIAKRPSQKARDGGSETHFPIFGKIIIFAKGAGHEFRCFARRVVDATLGI